MITGCPAFAGHDNEMKRLYLKIYLTIIVSLLLVVLADTGFLEGDPRRSIDSYPALKMRIWDDVRARQRDNPLSPLVRLT